MESSPFDANHSSNESEFISESSMSEHSFENNQVVVDRSVRYTSTNLISSGNLYLPDIQITQLTKKQIQSKYDSLLLKMCWGRGSKIFIDPRQMLKDAKAKGTVETMVDYEYAGALAQFALEMHLKHFQQSDRSQPQEGMVDIDNLQRFSSQVVHDHMRNLQRSQSAIESDTPILIPRKVCKDSKKVRLQKEYNKHLLSTIKELRNVEGLPLKLIAQRLKVNYNRLSRICKNNFEDAEEAFAKRKKPGKFKKLFARARQNIDYFLSREEQAISLSDIQRHLLKTCQLRVSKVTLDNYLRSELNVSYRLIKPIAAYQNNPGAKLQ